MMEFFDYNTFMLPAEDIYDLAIKYKKGDGVERSNYIAADLFFKSASKGFALARIDLFKQTVLRPDTIPSYISIEKKWFDAVVSELKRKSNDGDNEASLLLGFAYQDGIGVNEDYQKAFEYHSKAAAEGNAAAINALGLMYSHGYGVKKNVDIAMNYFQQALEHGYYNAAVNMAFHYKKGDGINKDLAKALELFVYAALNGHWRGQYEYAKILKDGILCNKDEKLAFKFCFKAASLGEKTAQKLLGDMYLEGIGVDTDLRKSLIWYCKAAEQEYGDAVNKIDSLRSQIERDDFFIDDRLRERIALILYREDRVGWPYDYVAGIRNERSILADETYKDYLKRDNTIPFVEFLFYVNYDSLKIVKADNERACDEKAINWLIRGQEIQDAPSISLLGECYSNDFPTTDYAKALDLFQKASMMGFHRATFLLGQLYFNGNGTEKNFERAIQLYQEAANHQIGEAYLELGNLYFKGKYINKNVEEAFRCYNAVTAKNSYSSETISYAKCNLAYMYQFGLGTNSDLLKAAQLYQEADDNNGSSACNYARMVQQYDFPDTVEDVITWYEKAIDKSNVRAMYNLALMYIKGDGVEHNYEKAVSLLSQALEKQSPQAQLLMAIAYKSGFMVKKDKKQSKVLIRKVNISGKRVFLYSWYFTFANKNMIINADYIPNQIAPESEMQMGVVRGLTFNENVDINPYQDLEAYIYHITANDPVSEKALQMVIRMYRMGKGAPQSTVLSNYWSSYILPVDSSRINYDNNENDYFDLQAELERKFDELFGPLNDDVVVQGKTVNNDEPKNSIQEPQNTIQNTELDNLDSDLDNIVTLIDEEGNPVQFEFLDLVEYQGKEYVILLPTEENFEDSGEVVILEVIDTDGDEESYISVDNEENLQAVFNIFKEKFISEFDFID